MITLGEPGPKCPQVQNSWGPQSQKLSADHDHFCVPFKCVGIA